MLLLLQIYNSVMHSTPSFSCCLWNVSWGRFFLVLTLSRIQSIQAASVRRILNHMQKTTFEIIKAKGEIAHNEQFLLLSQLYQLFSLFILAFVFSLFLTVSLQGHLLQNCCFGERVTHQWLISYTSVIRCCYIFFQRMI